VTRTDTYMAWNSQLGVCFYFRFCFSRWLHLMGFCFFLWLVWFWNFFCSDLSLLVHFLLICEFWFYLWLALDTCFWWIVKLLKFWFLRFYISSFWLVWLILEGSVLAKITWILMLGWISDNFLYHFDLVYG
jgi:hypothetical protein